MKRTFDVPCIVTVVVEVEDGVADVKGAYVDSQGGPWAFSGEPVAYDNDYEGGTWFGQMQEKTADDDVEFAWRAAYDELDVTLVAIGD